MSFTEEWFSTQSCDVLATLAKSVVGLPGDIIEIGSWQGRSTVALANATHPERVHAVDTWQGSPGEISAELAAGRDVFAEFQRNIASLTRGNVDIYRMGWREFFDTHRRKVKLVFIDAEHTYEEVADNIETVLPLMVPGGVICGDDQHHPPVRQAVADTLGAAQVSASLWIHRV